MLYVTYQTPSSVAGVYGLCALFDEHLLIALPSQKPGSFDIMLVVQLSDVRVEAPTDGKGMDPSGPLGDYLLTRRSGLQCASNLHTWKISMVYGDSLYEILLSACSALEHDVWIAGLDGQFTNSGYHSLPRCDPLPTTLGLDLKPVGMIYTSQRSLTRESLPEFVRGSSPSVQRAATTGGRPTMSQVIVRNTYNMQDLHEFRDSTAPINRSQSHIGGKRIPILEPKRSERIRLEHSIGDIWTKERLPYPGMIGSRSTQILRASAGTIVRKLSLASISSTLTGRTSSLSISSRKSYDQIGCAKPGSINRSHITRSLPMRHRPVVPEVDDMSSVVGRMMAGGIPTSNRKVSSQGVVDCMRSTGSTRKRARRSSILRVGPDDPAAIFYEDAVGIDEHEPVQADLTSHDDNIGEGGSRRRRKRWSNPISKMRIKGSSWMWKEQD